MTVATAVDLQRLTTEMFGYFDRKEFDRVAAMMDSTVQGVDEISRRWMRGKSALDGYFAGLKEAGIDDMHSGIEDFHAEVVGDVGVVTFMLDQTYALDGSFDHILAPTTILFRRRGEEWCIDLVHSVPLPDAAA